MERYAEAAVSYEQCLRSYPAAARDFMHEQATVAYNQLGQYAQGLTAANRRSAEADPVVPYHKLLCQMGMGEYDAMLPVLLAAKNKGNYGDFSDRRYQLAVCQLRAHAGSVGGRSRNVQLAEQNLQRYLESAAGRLAPPATGICCSAKRTSGCSTSTTAYARPPPCSNSTRPMCWPCTNEPPCTWPNKSTRKP